MPVQLKRVAEALFRSEDGRYYALFRVRGRQLKRSLATSDRALAMRRLRALRGEYDGRDLPSRELRAMTWDALVATWKRSVEPTMRESSFRRREVALVGLLPFFTGAPLRSITPAMVDRWAVGRGRELSARSFNIERETLFLILRFAQERGWITQVPAAHVKRRRERHAQVVIPTRDQFQAVLARLDAQPKAGPAARLVEFLAYSGARLGEASRLTADCIDWKRGTITFRETKSHDRTVPLFPAVRELFRRMGVDRHSTGPLFPLKSAKRSLATACREAKTPHFGHHAFRHYFVSNCIEAGIDFKVISDWVGHSDGGILVARTYGHLRAEHSAAMAKRVDWGAIF